MALAPIPLTTLVKLGAGLKRPEGVSGGRDGRVWASDQTSACAEVRPDGTLRRVGKAEGAPNGITMDAAGRILIAGWGLDSGDPGPLQRLDPETGHVEVVCAEIAGRRLLASNYPVVDRHGNIWCSHSTWDVAAAWAGVADGFVYRIAPDGAARIMAEGFHFANGLALDAEESYLYVCQSVARNVVRCPIRGDDTLGAAEAVVVRTDPLGLSGYDLLAPWEQAVAVWQALAAPGTANALPAGLEALETARIENGVGRYGREYGEAVNPLEGGLRRLISFTKGCYTGQEVVARLNTYDKVQRKLVGVVLENKLRIAAGKRPRLLVDGQEVGYLTSWARPPRRQRWLALGYLRRAHAKVRAQVQVEADGVSFPARVASLPFRR